MADGLFNPLVDTQVYNDLESLRVNMPKPANASPKSEVTGGGVGAEVARYALEDHQHPRLTSTTMVTLGADGTAAVAFTRSFVNKPGVVMTEIDTNNAQPLVLVVSSFTQNGTGQYTGCVIKGYRSQTLPAQNQLSLVSLLGGVITGVNNLASTLTGFNVFGGTTAGSAISVIAVARSDVPAS